MIRYIIVMLGSLIILFIFTKDIIKLILSIEYKNNIYIIHIMDNVVSHKLLETIANYKDKSNDFIKIYDLAIKIDEAYVNLSYDMLFEKIRCFREFLYSIFGVSELGKVISTPLWQEMMNITKNVNVFAELEYKLNHFESIVSNFKEINTSVDISNDILHTRYNRENFILDENILPSKMSINILLQIGFFGLKRKYENSLKIAPLIKNEDNSIKLERLFNLPTLEEFNNYKSDTRFPKIEKDIYRLVIDYLFNNKDDEFLDKHEVMKLAKYIYNLDFNKALSILNKKKKSLNKKESHLLAQINAAISWINITLGNMDNGSKNLKDILLLEDSASNNNYLKYMKQIATRRLMFHTDTRDFDFDADNWYKISNFPKYERNISIDALYNDIIKEYSGSTSLGEKNFHFILKNTITNWCRTYIDLISFGLFYDISAHYLNLIKELIIEYNRNKVYNNLITEIFNKLIITSIDNASLKNILNIIKMMPRNYIEKDKIKSFINKSINKNSLNTLEIEYISVIINYANEKTTKNFSAKLESILLNNKLDFKDRTNRLSLSDILIVYLKILYQSKASWEERKSNLIELLKTESVLNNLLLSSNNEECKITYYILRLFKIYGVSENHELFKNWLLFLEIFHSKTSMTSGMIEHYTNKGIDYKNILSQNKYSDILETYSCLKIKIPNDTYKNYHDNFLLYFDGYSDYLPCITDDIFKSMFQYTNDLFEEYTKLHKTINNSSDLYNNPKYINIANYIRILIHLSKEKNEYKAEYTKLYNDYLKYCALEEHIQNIDVLMNTLESIIIFISDNDYEVDIEIIKKILSIDIKNIPYAYFIENYHERSRDSILYIHTVYKGLLYKIIDKEEITTIEILNDIAKIKWHRVTINRASILKYINNNIGEKDKVILQYTIIDWIKTSETSIGNHLLKVYHYIYEDDTNALSLLKDLSKDFSIGIDSL